MNIKKYSLATQIKEALLDRILKGKYNPGDRLVELTIAKELGVSQAPVREAFQILEAMRFVESQPNRGTRVRDISDREMSEGTIVRGVLEETAARMAAKHVRQRVTDLRAEVQGMADAIEKNDLDGFIRYAIRFHRMIVQACENSVLIETWESLVFEEKSRFCAQKAARSNMQQGVGAYEQIVEALAQGDGDKAGKLLREHAERRGELLATASGRMSAADFQKTLAEENARKKYNVQEEVD